MKNLTNEEKIIINGVFYGKDREKMTKEEVVQSLEFNLATTSNENLQIELKNLVEKIQSAEKWQDFVLCIPFEVDPVDEIDEALIGTDGEEL